MGEIYSQDIFEAARDKLTALVTTLITQMAADDPKVSFIYEKHSTAKLELNGVTIDLPDVLHSPEDAWSSTTKQVQYDMRFTVRVHTAYSPDGIRDGQKNARLVNSLLNKFKENISLGDGFFVGEISDMLIDEEFEDSVTYGGELSVQVTKIIIHTQE